MNALFTDLQWLPPPPEDFRARLRSLDSMDACLGRELVSVASHALDTNQLVQLAGVVERSRTRGATLEPLIPFRLALLANATVDHLGPALIASAVRHGISLEVVTPAFDQIAQEALSPDSTVNRSSADAVLFAIDYRALPLQRVLGDRESADAAARAAVGYLQMLRNGINSNSRATCIFQTFAPPVETLFGSLDRVVPGTMRAVLSEINRQLGDQIMEHGDILLDIAGIAETVGLADWHDTQLWNLGKFPFAEQMIPLYADHVARTLAAIRGKSRKVLVLDLDNTLWGGVLGDDGIEGIRIAQGDAVGEAHRAVQRMALDLRQRGIVLAVSSKNSDDIARTPFEQHPEMLLKLEDIAVFQANWNDKASNLKAIAGELSLGVDSLVFLDDNPVERGLVRALLPEVAVPELPADPAYYSRMLAAAGYFETVAFTSEDLIRADSYQHGAKRAQLQERVGDLEAYLKSLDMTISFAPFDANGRARIVQLINKSNQYNLTTRRYTDVEVKAAEQDPGVFTLQVRLVDLFGDNGMISVLICRPLPGATWIVDTWLMSCRVLGRRVENMVLRELLKHAHRSGVARIVGTYVPSGRNAMVADHYRSLGFTKVAEEDSGLTRWELIVGAAAVPAAPMRVISRGFDAYSASMDSLPTQ